MLINVSNDYADSSIYFGLDYVMILYAFWKSTRVLGISKGERASMIFGRGMFSVCLLTDNDKKKSRKN